MLFYYDANKDKLDGLIEETRTDSKLVLQKHTADSFYDNAKYNPLTLSLIRKAKIITKEEYNTASSVVDAMVDSSEWLIADNEADNEKEIVLEPTYAD